MPEQQSCNQHWTYAVGPVNSTIRYPPDLAHGIFYPLSMQCSPQTRTVSRTLPTHKHEPNRCRKPEPRKPYSHV